MSKNENAKLRFLKQLDAMSKIENVPNARVLRDDELDAVSGGLIYNFSDLLCSS